MLSFAGDIDIKARSQKTMVRAFMLLNESARKLGLVVVVVVGFYDTFYHHRSSASLFTLSVKSQTNFAQRL